VVNGFGGKARFVVENYGASELAKRFGVTRYPAIFVDDVLVATPKDFGFYGKGEGGGDGRYTPWRSAESHERFRADLARMVELILAGRKDAARAEAAPARPGEIAALPDLALTGLDGKPLSRADLAGADARRLRRGDAPGRPSAAPCGARADRESSPGPRASPPRPENPQAGAGNRFRGPENGRPRPGN
jgi:hypothetical protein